MNGDKREETDRDRRGERGGAAKKPTGEDGERPLRCSRHSRFSPFFLLLASNAVPLN